MKVSEDELRRERSGNTERVFGSGLTKLTVHGDGPGKWGTPCVPPKSGSRTHAVAGGF